MKIYIFLSFHMLIFISHPTNSGIEAYSPFFEKQPILVVSARVIVCILCVYCVYIVYSNIHNIHTIYTQYTHNIHTIYEADKTKVARKGVNEWGVNNLFNLHYVLPYQSNFE